MHLLGVSASALAWFKSYLSLRKQVIRIGSDLSDPLPLTVGVAQGSILGPVLFALYVNDLLSVPKKCEAMGYVDDTKLLLTLPPTCVTISDLNSDLREIAKWCSTNSLLINPNKTKLLVVGVPQLTRNLSLPPVSQLGKNISKPQLIQNFAGRIILGIKKFDYVSAARKSLGWLSVRQKLLLNAVTMVQKCRTNRSGTTLSLQLISW